MKRYLITVIGLFFYLQVAGQQGTDVIRIGPVENRYSKEKHLLFNIENSGKKNVFIVFALEKKSNGNWHEVLDDIFRTKNDIYVKRITVLPLKAGKSEKIKWYPKVKGLNLKGEYRFKIKYDYDGTDYGFSIVSKTFYF
jgi:hypothetical protein